MTADYHDLALRLRGARERVAALADRASDLRARLEGDVPLGSSLERLAATATPRTETRDEASRDDGQLVGDHWEISLVNEEGA